MVFVDPDGRRRQRVMGDAGSPKAERSYRQFLKDYLGGAPARRRRILSPLPVLMLSGKGDRPWVNSLAAMVRTGES